MLFTVASVVTGCSDTSAPAAPSRLAPYIAPSVGVSADIVCADGVLFSVHAEDLPVFRLLRLRARRIPALIGDAKDVLLMLFVK